MTSKFLYLDPMGNVKSKELNHHKLLIEANDIKKWDCNLGMPSADGYYLLTKNNKSYIYTIVNGILIEKMEIKLCGG